MGLLLGVIAFVLLVLVLFVAIRAATFPGYVWEEDEGEKEGARAEELRTRFSGSSRSLPI